MATITVLVDDRVHARGLLGEHGLAIWVDTGLNRVLFDTGQGLALKNNAERLGIDLASADAIVLSHGHYDHSGGVRMALGAAPDATLVVHPETFGPKFVRRESGDGLYVGVPEPDTLHESLLGRNVIQTREPLEVVPGVTFTGQIPRETGFEDTGGPFYRDLAWRQPDALDDEGALILATDAGPVALVGCAHAGVVNTMRAVAHLSRREKLAAVIGGMHLLRASAERLERTAAAVEEHGVDVLAPCHCTGAEALCLLGRRCAGRFQEVSVGWKLSVG